jgi:hypothetical protein
LLPIDYLILLMKLGLQDQMVNEMKKLLAALPVVTAALVLAASGAHAFTFENSGSNSSGSSIVDPDSQIKGSGNASATSREGGTGLRFSVGPSSGSGLTNRSNSPPGWVGNPLFLDKGSPQSGQ